MGNRRKVPSEQPQLKALVNAVLDYLLYTHKEIVLVIIKDWLQSKEEKNISP